MFIRNASFFRLALPALLLFVVNPCFAEQWKLVEARAWSRQPDSISFTKEKTGEAEAGECFRVVHSGKQDWHFSGIGRIPVRAGDCFELEASLQREGSSPVSISVTTRKKDGEVLRWTYGRKDASSSSAPQTLKTTFLVPEGIESIEPRITGAGAVALQVGAFTVRKTGHRELAASPTEPILMENRFLSVSVAPSDGSFAVTDKRTGRTWKPVTPSKSLHVISTGNGKSLRLLDLESTLEYEVGWSLENETSELLIRLEGKGPMPREIAYPPPFESQEGDRLIVPLGEGIGYPVDDKTIGIRRIAGYTGHGLCMSFWGHVEDASGAGMLAILETPDDVSIDTSRPAPGRMVLGTVWESSLREFRYPRKIRFVFFDRGGPVALCKRYRDYAKSLGYVVPFTEKAKWNPDIDRLLGAANIWYFGSNKLALLKEMRELGMDRILWSADGSPAEIDEMNRMDKVLTSRYDIYKDIMNPERLDEVGRGGYYERMSVAWPDDLNWSDPDGTLRKGWAVTPKDKTKPRIHCGALCDSKAVGYARNHIAKERETKRLKARFLDTTTASAWYECYHPDHPMTRSDSKRHRMELLELVRDFGLVVGSENGHDASVPYCDFFEGMLSLSPYRIADSGRNMVKIVDDPPSQIERYQVNPALRLPLWELVYHDCAVAQWYWGDYNNKLPKVWRQRDLFNALYGTPPMYLFARKYWDENKNRFAESYKTANGTTRATAYAEMTDHRILSPDRLVQQTVFSNGVTVIVNFGEKPFKLEDGSEIAAMDWKMKN